MNEIYTSGIRFTIHKVQVRIKIEDVPDVIASCFQLFFARALLRIVF